MLVSIPHFGTDPLPGTSAADFRSPDYVNFPYGYTDPFAAQIYGGLHADGATVVAAPLSRLFVDVNRARDDYQVVDGAVESNRGVIRTHIRGDEALFTRPLTPEAAEMRLQQYYDPFHDTVDAELQRITGSSDRAVLLDSHTASERYLGDHEVVIGTARGRACAPELAEGVAVILREAGWRVSFDVPGYSGGHLVRRHGSANGSLQAVQIEFNSALVMRGTRPEYARACRDGVMPPHDEPTLARCIACMREVVSWLAGWCAESPSRDAPPAKAAASSNDAPPVKAAG